MFETTLGAVSETILMMAINLGQPLPQEVEQKIVLNEYEEFVLESYILVSSERNSGFDYSHIPRSKVFELGKSYGMEYEDTWSLYYIIKQMDDALIEDARKKEKK